jgi:cytochrome b561
MPKQRYHAVLRLLHWFIAITIIGLFAVGLYMTGLEKENALRPTMYGLHKSFGALLLSLVVLRIVVRFATAIPPMPLRFAKWERGLAHVVHFVLYCLMIGVPLSGIFMSNSWGHGVSMFGLELPRLFPENRDIAPLSSEIHEILAFTIIGLVVLHALGVIKHRFVDKHDILYRMTFGAIPAHVDDRAKDA